MAHVTNSLGKIGSFVYDNYGWYTLWRSCFKPPPK